MATKNFLFGLVLSLLSVGLLSCNSLNFKTRKEVEQQRQRQQGGQLDPSKPVAENQAPEVQAEAPEFLQKDPPKLGLILGAGGALSYAHIGFLQELETQKIPIHTIAGVEWGALVAGAYAVDRKAHSVEWNLLKLPVDKFDNSGFFSSGKQGVKASTFDGFLNKIFGGKAISNLSVPFTCPFANLAKEKVGVRRSGRMRNAVRSCWALPPHFKVNPVGANPMGVADVAAQLRSEGAELIVYVDVVSENSLVPENKRLESSESSLIWVAQKSLPVLLKPPVVDEVIKISLSGHNITSYKSLRSIIRNGQLKSKSLVKGLAKKYAY